MLETGESPTVEQRDRSRATAAQTSSGAGSFGAIFSAARKSAACSRIPRSRVPRSSSTAATCKCTPNGATAPRRCRRSPTPACQRGYQYSAVTDHSYGLKIAGGMSMAEAAEQRKAIDDVNARCGNQFRLLQGIEANIDAAGQLDLTDDEAATFDVVLAAPHSRLRRNEDQTDRMLAAVAHPAVRILAHPRGRITGSRAGVIANWDAVFAAAAQRGVAIEIDGDPARQDLDHTLAAGALEAGCLFALDSDAHTTTQLVVCRDRTRACASCGYSRRTNRELLAARPASGLAVESSLRASTVTATHPRPSGALRPSRSDWWQGVRLLIVWFARERLGP